MNVTSLWFKRYWLSQPLLQPVFYASFINFFHSCNTHYNYIAWALWCLISPVTHNPSLKRKCHFDEILITGCIGSCHFDNFQCSQWWNFHQTEDICVSVVWLTTEASIATVGVGLSSWVTGVQRCPIAFIHLPWTKWPLFRGRHFQMHFLEWKVLYFDSNFTEVCS